MWCLKYIFYLMRFFTSRHIVHKKDIFIIWIDDGVNVHLAFGFCWNRRINLVLRERSLLIYCNENVNSRYVSIISPWGSKICTSSKFNYWNAVLLTDYLSKWTLVYNRFHFGISRLKFRIIHLCHICMVTKSVSFIIYLTNEILHIILPNIGIQRYLYWKLRKYFQLK